MGILVESVSLRDRIGVFDDRTQAGRMLAGMLVQHEGTTGMILAIPAGGVPVGREIALLLGMPMDLIIVRKVQIPDNPEAGFGAVTPEGTVLLNDGLLKHLGLPDDIVHKQIEKARVVIAERDQLYRGGRPVPSLRGAPVIIVDDGLASGYTMRAAVHLVRSKKPASVIVAVPTGHELAVNEILPDVDKLVCINIRGGHRFAVASAYRHWSDVSDGEVLSLVGRTAGNRTIP